MNQEERKVIDTEPYIYARKIKETIHSIKDKNHINNILHQGVNIINTVYPNGNKADYVCNWVDKPKYIQISILLV